MKRPVPAGVEPSAWCLQVGCRAHPTATRWSHRRTVHTGQVGVPKRCSGSHNAPPSRRSVTLSEARRAVMCRGAGGLLVCGRGLAGSRFTAGGLEGAGHRHPLPNGEVSAHEAGCACESVAVDIY